MSKPTGSGLKNCRNKDFPVRFRAINSQNVATFFPTQKWNDEISCALFSDINPEFDNLLPSGTKIMFPFDGKLIFGTVLSVLGRNATVSLEEEISGQNIITVNWSTLRLADNKYRNLEEKERNIKDEETRKRTEKIKIFVKSLRENISATISTDEVFIHDTIPVSEFIEKQKILIDYVDQMNSIKNIIVDIYNELKVSKNDLIKQGVLEQDLPEIPNISEEILHLSRSYRKKQNDQIRKKLASVRSITRTLLVKALLHAGQEGLTSEQIVLSICDENESSQSSPKDITPHRVMGMLSALSRNKQVFLNENNFWVATEKINDIDTI